MIGLRLDRTSFIGSPSAQITSFVTRLSSLAQNSFEIARVGRIFLVLVFLSVENSRLAVAPTCRARKEVILPNS